MTERANIDLLAIGSNGEATISSLESIEFAMKDFDLNIIELAANSLVNIEESEVLRELLPTSDCAAVLLLNEPIQESIQLRLFVYLHEIASKICSKKRGPAVHVIKNYTTSSAKVNKQIRFDRQQRRGFHFWDLETTAVKEFVAHVRKSILTDTSLSNPGQSFAWQLVVSFLSYILPNLRGQIRNSLLDGGERIRQDLLTEFGITGVDPSRVLVVPRFLLLLDERIVSGQQSVSSVYPQHLFPGCSKICSESTELSLQFDSPGYKKRVPAYLMHLEQSLTKAQSRFTHAVIFCCYAAPMFIMQKLSMSDQEKMQIFEQFRDELGFIQRHPRANAILRELSDCSSEGVSESEPGALCVIDMKDEDSLKSSIVASIEDFLLIDDWRMVSSVPEWPFEVSFEYSPKSTAFAWAANVWFGFAQPLSDYLSQLPTDGEQLPFDLPYFFVIPRSGRFPDESKLLSRFAEVGAQSSVQEFRAASGRRYSFRVHEWKSRRIAFEIPPCVLGLRRQVECGVGGINAVDVPAHLAEFRDALGKIAADVGEKFRVAEWDDVTGFEENVWSEPSTFYSLSLLNFLESSVF